MGRTGLLTQSQNGTLLPGERGERIINHYSFYAAFTTPEEFSLAVEGKIIGTLPIDRPLAEGAYLVFAGRRWCVLRLDTEHKRIDLARATGGRAPPFGGTPGVVHDVVRAQMFDLYNGSNTSVYLDGRASELLAEGRHHFRELGLHEAAFVEDGKNTLIYPWAGDIAMDTLAALLTYEGIQTEREGVCLTAKETDTATLQGTLQAMREKPTPSGYDLAAQVQNKETEKYDFFLDEHLLKVDWASKRLDTHAAIQIVHQLTGRTHSTNPP